LVPQHPQGALADVMATTMPESRSKVSPGTPPSQPLLNATTNAATEKSSPAVKGAGRLATINGNTKWRIEGDQLVQTNPTGRGEILFGDLEWTDYDVFVEGKRSGGKEGFLVFFRTRDRIRNSPFFGLGVYGNKFHESRHNVNGQWSRNLPPLPASIDDEQWQFVRVEVRGDRFRCFLNDKLWFNDKDNRFPKGQIGLGVWDTPVRFRNIRVLSPNGAVLWEGLPELPD